MAGLTVNPADIAKAREAGYSDDEITSFLSQRAPDQFKAAHEAGYSAKEILSHLTGDDSKPSGAMAGAQEGLAGVAKGVGSTLHTYLGQDPTGLEEVGKKAAPENYHGADLLPQGSHWYDPRTYNFGALPQMAAEAAPGMATDIAAAKLASKIPVVGKYAGPAAGIASYLLRTRGQAAKNDAVIRTGDQNAEPELQDKARALATGAAESVPQALGIGRFLPGGKVPQTAGQALAKLGITTATEGGAGAASNAISQAGATIGTPGGLKIDPNEVASSGVTTGLIGGGMAIPGAVADVHGARKYAPLGGDNQAASEVVVKRVTEAADTGNLKDTGTAYNAMRDASENIRDELKQSIKPLKGTLDEDTQAALKKASKGLTLTDSNLADIEANTTPDVAFLARQAHVASLMKGQGDYGNGQFVGGLANSVAKHVRALQNPVGAGVSAALGAASLGGHAASLFAYGPETLAAIGAGYFGLKGVDKLTGARSPMASIAERFQNPEATTRLPQPTVTQPAPPPGAGPTGPNVPFNPGVASGNAMLATGASPWAPKPSPEPAPTIDPLALPSELVKKSKTLTQALANVQKMREANTPPAPTPPPTIDPLALPKDITGKGKTIVSALQNVADMRDAAQPQMPEVPTPPTPINPMALPKDMVSQAKTLTSALKLVQEMRDKSQAKDQVDRVASESPLVQDAGGLGAIENPQVGKKASAYVSAANALKKLMQQPEEEAAPSNGPPGESQPTTMADILQNVTNASKAAHKLSKKDGKVTDTAAVQEPQPEPEAPYETVPDSELWRKGLTDAQVAERELGKYDPEVRKKYSKNVIANRTLKRDTLEELANNASDEDSTLMGKLYHRLDHVSRRGAARKEIDFWTAKMSPAGKQAVETALHPLMSKLWSKE
jgi:hypothetical protein